MSLPKDYIQASPPKPSQERSYKPSRQQLQSHRHFTAAKSDRLLSGDIQAHSINYWLRTDLEPLRARSREQVRNNPYATQFVNIMESNIVGPSGVKIQSQIRFLNGDLDRTANNTIEAVLKDWAEVSDYGGTMSFEEMQCLAIATAATDGEILARKRQSGPFGFQIELLDPARIDYQRNQTERDGSQTILGVNYLNGQPNAYFLKDVDQWGQYRGETKRVEAKDIYHCFKPLFVGQARGIPWMFSSLYSMKMLDGYDEAAITAARAGAAKMGFFTGGAEGYSGDDTDANGSPIQEAEPGHFEDLGDREFTPYDPNYPHEQYPHFVKQTLRRIAAGQNVSYNTLAKDLEGVNYSSIRAGVLEDRENFKRLQNWFIRCFVRPIYRDFVSAAIMSGAVTEGSGRTVRDYLPAAFQPRRWAWVDPQKDMAANREAIELRLRSYSSVIRDQGDDPETVWAEIARDEERMAALNIAPIREIQNEQEQADQE